MGFKYRRVLCDKRMNSRKVETKGDTAGAQAHGSGSNPGSPIIYAALAKWECSGLQNRHDLVRFQDAARNFLAKTSLWDSRFLLYL